MTIEDAVSNFWGAVGAGLAVIGTITVAIINTRSQAQKKETAKIKELEGKVVSLENEFKSLKKSFTLVCDEMELNGTMTPQLKNFRKIFNL